MHVLFCAGASSERVSVVKLQVGLLGTARSMQRDLDRIAGRADTSNPSGLHYVLQGVSHHCFTLFGSRHMTFLVSRSHCLEA